MKIEKINDNQIRCTLYRQDLENHQIRLSELAYGTEKAKQLFRDMIEQAHTQFGFEADNIPLMIEAIPVNTESIVLIITKVEDPEELDTRFSKFAPFQRDLAHSSIQLDGADSILDLIQKLHERAQAEARRASGDAPEGEDAEETAPPNLVHLFSFRSLDNVIEASHGLRGFYNGSNALYREPGNGRYLLALHQDDSTPEDFNKVCNILSEYGDGSAFTEAGEAYLREHADLISDNALSFLAEI
ncbi:MAG: adaptor protein MecA [Blautia sp.]|nr:adaptor protein MecA [Blautia sp.]